MRTANPSTAWLLALGLGPGAAALVCAAQEAAASGPALTEIAAIRRAVGGGVHTNCPIRLEGTVCWADAREGLLVVRNSSGAIPVLAEFPAGGAREGLRVRVEGVCSARRSGLEFVLEQALTVDNDGLHDPKIRSGSAELDAGLTPIRLAWFNSRGEGVLNLTCEGPGIARGSTPASLLLHPGEAGADGGTTALPGLTYRAWEGEWDCVPDFGRLTPAAEGVAEGFDARLRTRPESAGLEFAGWLRTPAPGRYTFHLESDDGSLLWVGKPSLRVTSLGPDEAWNLEPAAAEGDGDGGTRPGWRVVEGEIAFAARRRGSLRLELGSGRTATIVDVLGDPGGDVGRLTGGRIRIAGIVSPASTPAETRASGYLWAPSWRLAEFTPPAAVTDGQAAGGSAPGNPPPLTTIGRLRRLTPRGGPAGATRAGEGRGHRGV